MEEKILFESYVGSKLYGTNSETSDTDIKGVFLPKINDLILCRAPKHYTSSTGSIGDRNTSKDIDKTYYSLQYFLELLAKGETNALDLFFAYTNNFVVLQKDSIWDKLIENKDKIITKNVNAYIGYCKSQCIKYSLKGDKLKNYKELQKMCNDYFDEKDDNGNTITLYQLLQKAFFTEEFGYPIKKLPECGKENREKLQFTQYAKYNFGNHCYLETAENKESYLTVSDVKFELNSNIKTTLNKINRTIVSYGKRAEIAANSNGADYKAISHCVRVIFQIEELLTDGKITFPLVNADFVKSIKYNTTNLTYEEIMQWIENKINYIDVCLIPNCKLREKADYKWIEKFILSCYQNGDK